jgi:AraC-like DNA-binding protein
VNISADPLVRTTAAGWAISVINTLLEHDVDPGLIKEAVGWGGDAPPCDLNGRMSATGVLRLWSIGETRVGEHFGLEVGRRVNPKTLDLLGASIWYSGTIREAFARLAKYSQLIHRTGRTVLHARGRALELRFHIAPDERDRAPAVALDAFVAAVCCIVQQIHYASTKPLEVLLQRQAPLCADRYDDLFGVRVAFGAPCNALVFDAGVVDEPLSGSQRVFACEIDRMIERHLRGLGIIDARALVSARILERMRGGELSLSTIAREMGTTSRNVQWLLAADGTSYSALLRELRQEMALAALADASLTIQEAGASLGFAESSSFTRAFRSWFGVAPAVYRRDSSTLQKR